MKFFILLVFVAIDLPQKFPDFTDCAKYEKSERFEDDDGFWWQ